MMEIMFAKKQIIITFLTLLITTIAWGQTTFSGGGSGTEADPYVLLTKADWNAFAESVNAKKNPKTYEGEYLRLGNDITDIDVMVGWFTGGTFASGNVFRGNFDGDWHTLTVSINGSTDYSGPFGWVDGATIRNLTVDGTITINKSGKHGGGIVSCVEDKNGDNRSTIIENCTSKVTIVCNNERDGYHGGVVGWLYSGSLNFENCIFEGRMTGNTNNCAGFVGEIDNNQLTKSVCYTNCTQAYIQIENSPTTFGTYHFPSDFVPSTPVGQENAWQTAYYIRRITNDRQGARAYLENNVPGNTILKIYYRDNNYFVPQANVDLNETDIYTLPLKPTITYYGRELIEGEHNDYTVVAKEQGDGKYMAIITPVEGSNYYCKENINGEHAIIIGNLTVNSINDWASLKSLLADDTKTRHITLNDHYTDKLNKGALKVKGSVILNMNGHTIDRYLFSLPANYKPSDDVVIVNNGNVTYPVAKTDGYVMLIESGADVTIKGGGTIKGGCNKGNGGGIYNNGTLTIDNVNIKENFTIRKGGDVYGTGTGIYSASGSTLYVNNCHIFENVGDGGGGGICALGTFIIKDTHINLNRTNSKAGGIRLNTASANVIRCKIIDNVVKNQGAVAQDASDGAGIYVERQSGSVVSNCEIKRNICAWKGGGIFVHSGGVTVIDSEIVQNSALGDQATGDKGGGGIFLSGGSIKLVDCVVEENTSYTVGGAFIMNNNFSIEGKTIINNNIGDANKANVYIGNTTDKIKVTGPLDASAIIGISRDASGEVTSGLKNKDWAVEDNFKSDNYQLYWLVKDDKKEVSLKSSLYWEQGDDDWRENFYVDEDGNQYIGAPIIIQDGQRAVINRPIKYGRKGYLFIEDGGQLIYNQTPTVKVSVLKRITAASKGYERDVYGWYTISSPVGEIKLAGAGAGVNLVTSELAPYNFDLLRYDEATSYWQSYTDPNNTESFTMERGRGYLYRNLHGITLEYTGNTQQSVSYNLSYSPTTAYGKLAGWNLIGNPYTHNIYKGGRDCAIVNGGLLADGFYRLTNSGAWGVALDDGTAIKPGEGILVKAEQAGELIITNTDAAPPAKKSNNDYIKFTVANNSYDDVTYAIFDEGYGLPKLNHRNADIPMVYINKDDDNYAIAMMNDNVKSFNLNFKAKTTGQYTLSCNTEGDFSYLHVIDKLAGRDIDMLLDEKYTFIGSPRDTDARFIVRLSYNGGEDESDEFAYQNGNDIVVCGEGELQVYDVMGRFVTSQRINGVETINMNANGVYILKLIGNEIKTQKIVVR